MKITGNFTVHDCFLPGVQQRTLHIETDTTLSDMATAMLIAAVRIKYTEDFAAFAAKLFSDVKKGGVKRYIPDDGVYTREEVVVVD